MELIEGTYKSDDGKDYYEMGLNLKTGDKVLIKNSSCSASAIDMAEKYFTCHSSIYAPNFVKVFFLGSDPELISEKIPKKYHKIVFG